MRVPRLTPRRLASAVLAIPVVAGLAWIGDVFIAHDNFRTASAGLYRSGELRDSQWQRSLNDAHYRSVLNLVGAKPDAGWYKREIKFAADNGLAHYDYALKANVAPTVEQMKEIVAIMRDAPKPLLIHCKNGSDRSGLVAALYRLAIDGQPKEVAGQQLSLWYGHFPWLGSGSRAMDVAFEQFTAAASAQATSATENAKPL